MSLALTPEALQILIDFDDETFIAFLGDALNYTPDEDQDFSLLYQPAVLRRLAQLKEASPEQWYGVLLPTLRRNRAIHQADLEQQMREVSGSFSLDTTSMHMVAGQEVEWLWWPYLALGTLAMLDGDPGIGKSLLTQALAAANSRGWPLPDQQGVPTMALDGPAETLFFAKEDSLSYTVRPRLDALQADLSRIRYVQGVSTPGLPTLRSFTLEDTPVLDAQLTAHPARLVVLDPIQAYLGPKVDMHRANETRPLLDKLTALAEKHQCCILCVRHPAKASGQGGGKAMLRGLGSIDFIGAARTGLFVEQHPLDPTLAVMAMSKSNLGPLGRTLIYSKAQGHFAWHGVTRLDAELLAGSSRGPDPQMFMKTFFWLEQRLEGGIPVPAQDILDQATEALDVSEKLVRRVKNALKVRVRKVGDHWEWLLPSLPVENSPKHIGESWSSNTTYPYSPSCPSSGISSSREEDDGNTQVSYDDRVDQDGPVVVARTGARHKDRASNKINTSDQLRYTPLPPCPVCGATHWQDSVSPPRCLACGARL